MKRFLLLLLCLIPSPALAATKTLCASGCDYTACSSWVSYLQGLSSSTGVLTEPEILEVRESVSTTCSLTTGITTSASNYWEIKAWTTCKHAGLYAAGKCEITSADANYTIFISAQGYWRITNMIISNTGAATGGNNRKGVRAEALAAGEARVTNSIFRHTNAGTDNSNRGLDVAINGAGTYKMVIANSIAHDWIGQGFDIDVRDLDTLVFYNNTSHGNAIGVEVNATNGTTETCRVKNNILDTNTTDFSLNSGSACATQTLADNLTADTTGTSGDTSKNPTYVNEAGDDFTLLAGDGVDAATDLSADGDYALAVDIIGTVRPQNTVYDMGASEVIAATVKAFSVLNALGED